jgi:hypothetical protein
MALISTKLHGVGDYATGVGLLAAPRLLRMSDGLASSVLRGTGVAILGVSAMTDYELGLRRRLPMPAHLGIDAATGAMLAAGALALRRRGRGVANWLPHGVVGVGQIGGALLTAHRPGDRVSAGVESASPAPEAPPPPPAAPAQTTPSRPRPRRAAPDFDDEVFVAQEESSAAAEAGRIGGIGPRSAGDPAMDPVYQAGGGEQEGWEEAEAELIENASHGDGHGDPSADAFTPEAESDRSGAVYAEADSLPSSEVEEDAGEGEDTSGTTPRAG